METEQETFIDQLFTLLEQLIIPNWNDLIRLLPWTLIALIVLFVLRTALQWRRAGEINRPRVAPPLAAGAPPVGVHMPGPSRWPFVVPVGVFLLLLSFALPARDASGAVTLPFNPLLLVVGLLLSAAAVTGWLIDAMREWRSTAQGEHAAADALEHGAVAELPGVAAPEAFAPPLIEQSPMGAVAAPRSDSALVVVRDAGAIAPVREVVAHRGEIEASELQHMPSPSPWPFFAPIALTLIFLGVIFSVILIIGGLILGGIAAAGWYLEASRDYRSTEEAGHAIPATLDPVRAWPRRVVPVFAAVIAISLLGALAPLGLNALNSLRPAPASPTPLAVPAMPEISASSAVSFDTGTLIVPCCRPFELVFQNNDAGVPHNVEITDGPQMGQVFFDGEVINGVASVTYQVPALTEGDYYFLCKIHPNMNGTLRALPESGPPPGGPPVAPSPGGATPAH